MPTKRRSRTRNRRASQAPADRTLTFHELLELLIGAARGSVFTDEAERLAAWRAHGSEILGRNPHCWAARRYDGAPRPPWHDPRTHDSATHVTRDDFTTQEERHV